jgi:hypothetical protein
MEKMPNIADIIAGYFNQDKTPEEAAPALRYSSGELHTRWMYS